MTRLEELKGQAQDVLRGKLPVPWAHNDMSPRLFVEMMVDVFLPKKIANYQHDIGVYYNLARHFGEPLPSVATCEPISNMREKIRELRIGIQAGKLALVSKR